MSNTKSVEGVLLYCSNPYQDFCLSFDTLENAKRDISERIAWGELERVTVFYSDGSKDITDYDSWD